MWQRCVAGAWRLKSPMEDKTCFPSATLVDFGMSRVKTSSESPFSGLQVLVQAFLD